MVAGNKLLNCLCNPTLIHIRIRIIVKYRVFMQKSALNQLWHCELILIKYFMYYLHLRQHALIEIICVYIPVPG